jgi:WD40 repeat protein
MKTLDIFISSPGDVREEREKARQVIEQLQHSYGSRVALKALLWEDLPLGADASFQQGIDLLLSEKYNVEIAIFVVWSRIGSPPGPPLRSDGTQYRSGTEREFEFMLEARRRNGGKRPHILAYSRSDDESFNQVLDARKTNEELKELLQQRELAHQFISETFHDEEGRNVRAYHTYDRPHSFAKRLQTHLRNLIDETHGDAGTGAAVWEESPYRGLLTFDVRHAPIYFGRETEVCEVELLLRRRAETGNASVVIVGPSGLGKSSLARAGVAHGLVHGNLDDTVKVWRFAAMQPAAAQGNLFGTLVRSLADPDAMPELAVDGANALEAFQKTLAVDPSAALALKFDAAVRLAARSAGGDVKLLLLVDQLEELWLDKEIVPEAREAFLRALGALAAGGSVWVLATLRSDMYPIAMQSEGFVRLKQPARQGGDCDGIFDLGPPEPAAIHRLIKEPAALAGLRFEREENTGRSLDQDLLRDTAGHADALPLLEYALEQLFEQRTAEGVLTFGAYEKLGGVEGALGKRAEQTFAALPAQARDALPEILPLLIAVDVADARNTSRRHAPLAGLTATEGRRLLTESLIAARFLTTDELEGAPVATLAHEALLRRWERLQTWLAENRELLELREHVRTAAADWRREREKGRGGADDLLLAPGLPLSRGERALEAGVLDQTETEFVKSSLARERAAQRGKRRRLQVIALAAALAAIIMALMAWQATRKTSEVKKLLAESDSERADRLFAEGDGASAIWYLCRAVSSGSPTARMKERLWFALAQRSWPLAVIDPVKLDAEVTAVTFDPSGERFAIATRDGAVSIFSSADGKAMGAPLPHPKTVRGIQFSPDGTKLLTACDDAQARLWDVSKSAAVLLGASKHGDVVAAIAWSGDGARYATGSWDKQLCVWDPAHPDTAVFHVQMKDKVHTVAFDPKNPRRVLGVAKDEVCVWDIGSTTPVLDYQATEDLNGACFSADGSKALSFGDEGDVVISDLAGGMQQWAQLALGDSCREAAFSPDGGVFAVAFGPHISAYTLEQPPSLLWEHNFPDNVTRIKFTTEGKRLLTGCDDGKIEVFDARAGNALSEPIVEPGSPVGLDFHAVGNRVLSARSARTARIWGLSPPSPLPVAAYSLAAPPVLLKMDSGVECIAQNGKGVAFALPGGTEGSSQGGHFDFKTPLAAAAVGPSGAIVAGANDGRVLVMEGGQSREIGKLDSSVSQLAFSAAGALLGAGGDNGHLALWRWPEAAAIPSGWSHADRIGGLVFLEPGPDLVSASWDHEIALTEAKPGSTPAMRWPINGEPQVAVTDPAHRLALVALSTGAAWLVSAAPPGASIAFSLGSPPSSAAFSPDGGMVAVGTVVGTVTVWNTRDHVKICDIHCGDARVNSLCFGMGGRWLAAGMEDGQACVYESVSGQPITEAMLHPTAVRQVVLSKDNQYLVTATRDGTVLVWPLAHTGDAERAVEIARNVMQDDPDGRRFIPRADLAPGPDAARIRQFIESMRAEGGEAMRPEIDLLNSYLGDSPAKAE